MKIIDENGFLKKLPCNKKRVMFENLMEQFDFIKVKSVMDFLNWTWFAYDSVPTIDEMKIFILKMYNDIYDMEVEINRSATIGSGGFELEKIMIEDEIFEIRLIFIISEWTVCNVLYNE